MGFVYSPENGFEFYLNTPRVIRHPDEASWVKEEDIQFYLGYSGWGVGQLRAELDRQSWFVRKGATSQEIFDMESDILWKSILKQMGGKYKVFSNYPVDPRLN